MREGEGREGGRRKTKLAAARESARVSYQVYI